jgi:hypothetical protein
MGLTSDIPAMTAAKLARLLDEINAYLSQVRQLLPAPTVKPNADLAHVERRAKHVQFADPDSK